MIRGSPPNFYKINKRNPHIDSVIAEHIRKRRSSKQPEKKDGLLQRLTHDSQQWIPGASGMCLLKALRESNIQYRIVLLTKRAFQDKRK